MSLHVRLQVCYIVDVKEYGYDIDTQSLAPSKRGSNYYGVSFCYARKGGFCCGSMWVSTSHGHQGWEVVMWQKIGRSHSTNPKHGGIAAMLILFSDMGYVRDAVAPERLCITRSTLHQRILMILILLYHLKTWNFFVHHVITTSITAQM